jgi:hypothetical protein
VGKEQTRGLEVLTYAPAVGAVAVAAVLALALLFASVRSHFRGRRRPARDVVETLSPERRATIEQFVR